VNGFSNCPKPTAAPSARTFRKSNSGGLLADRIARVIFCMGEGHMILLHGFVKKTQKTPQADIGVAPKRKTEVT
jgi:phage-related protein